MAKNDYRVAIQEALEQRRWKQAHALLGDLWNEQPTSANAAFVATCFETLRPHVTLAPCRVAFLRSCTLEPAVDMLRAAALTSGLDLTVWYSDFNAYSQEILDSSSHLYGFSPHIAVLVVRTSEIAPELWSEFTDCESEGAERAADRAANEIERLLDAFRNQCSASVIVHNFECPAAPAQGILDTQIQNSQVEIIQDLNRRLRAIARERRGVYVLDYEALQARAGREDWSDERKWIMMRLPFAAASLNRMAREWLRFLEALRGRPCKVLVTDLDNTLWGGVLGEDGINGIKVGPDYPGAMYLAVQRALLDLSRRGIILAVASKNNLPEALEALSQRPEMLLRARHFAALRIGWGDKATAIREIAEELNVGVDSVAFLDDSPRERQQVRMALPEVRVLPLPEDPAGFASAIRNCAFFERVQISKDDQARARYYQEQKQRAELKNEASSIDDFYRSLGQIVEITPVTERTVARVAQLTQKTNQFNLTTRRYTEQQISAFVARPDWQAYSIRVRDRFGDNGIVGVALVHGDGKTVELDTLLLSCRVIRRTVETGVIAFLAEECHRRGVERLQGWFNPTKKNAPAADFYAAHGFSRIAEDQDRTLWELDTSAPQNRCPEWIRLVTVTSATCVYAAV
jgi:FkbH-like protein